MQRRLQMHLMVSGNVQEAGFRAALQRNALRWGVVGWVRNLEDGRVEAVIQSTEANVNALIGWCQRGALHEYVEDVQVKRQPLEAFSTFDARRDATSS